jgi:hypothetical protein
MYNYLFVLGCQNGGRNRHILDRKPSAERRVMLPDLLSVVQILLSLDGTPTGFRENVDIGDPFATPGKRSQGVISYWSVRSMGS